MAPATGTPSLSAAEVEAGRAVAARDERQRRPVPLAGDAAAAAAPAEPAGGERHPPPRPPTPPPRSDGDAAADPSARKENLKGKEGRNTMDDIKRERNNAPLRRERASERVFSQNLN